MELNNNELLMAKQIVSSMIKDNVADTYLASTPEEQKSLMFAYFDSEIKKFHKFQMKLMTNTGARNAFCEAVFSII